MLAYSIQLQTDVSSAQYSFAWGLPWLQMVSRHASGRKLLKKPPTKASLKSSSSLLSNWNAHWNCATRNCAAENSEPLNRCRARVLYLRCGYFFCRFVRIDGKSTFGIGHLGYSRRVTGRAAKLGTEKRASVRFSCPTRLCDRCAQTSPPFQQLLRPFHRRFLGSRAAELPHPMGFVEKR